MQFRAVIKDQQAMKEFLGIVMTLSKLSKECLVTIFSNKLRFTVNEESLSSSPLVWADIVATSYFSEYNMKGTSAEHSEIMLSINPVNLARALTVLKNSATYCKIKLTNVDFPCFDVKIEIPSSTIDQKREISHYVPVQIIPTCDWSAYDLPRMPNLKIVLTIPTNRVIRNLIEKKKNLSPTIKFFATSNGELNIVSETEFSTVTTRYINLEIKDISPSEEEASKSYVEASCSVDCKKTALFLASLHLPNLEISCGLLNERLIKLQSEVREGVVIQCIIPAVCM